MKRIVTYLYEYHSGKKGKNTGFIKLDQKGADCRMELCVRGQGKDAERGRVYLVADGEKKQGLFLGEIALLRGNGDFSARFLAEQIEGSPYALSRMQGVGVRFDSGRYMASSWVERPDSAFQSGDFSEWEKSAPPKREEKRSSEEKRAPGKQMPQERRAQEETRMPERERMPEKRLPEEKRMPEEKQMPEKQDRNTEAPEAKPARLQSAAKEEPALFSPERGEDGAQDALRRIDLSEIHRLPKKNWYLCNNSFLIHGFFNYHYLVLREVEENGAKKMYLGVPGIYERPERAMALLFGFPEFESEESCRSGNRRESAAAAGAEAAPETPAGTFGYWFCLLDM